MAIYVAADVVADAVNAASKEEEVVMATAEGPDCYD